jgi:hypothetical protein
MPHSDPAVTLLPSVLYLRGLDVPNGALIIGVSLGGLVTANLPEVFGGEMCAFDSPDEANEILGLQMRHWNYIAEPLSKGDVHVPLLLEDEDGVAHGNDWAQGFMSGMEMQRHAEASTRQQNRSKRPLPLRLWEEIQEVLRRADGALNCTGGNAC